MSTFALADDNTTLAMGDSHGNLSVRLAPTASTRITVNELIALSEALVGVSVGLGQSDISLTKAERDEIRRTLRDSADPLIAWLAQPLESRTVSPLTRLDASAYVSWIAQTGGANVSQDLLEMSSLSKEVASELLDFVSRFPEEMDRGGSIADEFLWLLVRAAGTDPTPETFARALAITQRGKESGMRLKEDTFDVLKRACVDKRILLAR